LIKILCQGVVSTEMKEELGSLFCFFCGRKLSDKNVEYEEVDEMWDEYEVTECPTCHRIYTVTI
jgi:hypothetical protein